MDLGLAAPLHVLCGFGEEEADLVGAVNEAYTRLQRGDLVERVREAGALAFQYEQTYHGCGQCTFAAIMDILGECGTCAADAVFRGGDGLCGRAGL